METPKYRTVLLKLSGEALAGARGFGLSFDVMGPVCETIRDCVSLGVRMGIVIGGGNFWRGVKNGEGSIERTRADQMGMLATVMNCMAVADVLSQKGVESRIQSAVEISGIAGPFSRADALRDMDRGRVVFFSCGTGHPFFSTDTGAVLRAAEIGAEVVLLAKNIDGVYSADPAKVPDAVRYDAISYEEVLAKRLAVMDLTATSLAMDVKIPVMVFALKDPRNIRRAILGEPVGTLVGGTA